MATNPAYTQYHTQRFSFIGSPQQRDGTSLKDQRFLNLYPELITSPVSEGKKYYLKKRPGTVLQRTWPGWGGNGQGIYYWGLTGKYYTAFGGHLFIDGVMTITLTSATNRVGFTEYNNGSQSFLIVLDGNAGYIIGTSGSYVTITDPNFPSPHIPNPIAIDGYLFVARANSQTICNSALTDPNNWPADGFIDAEMYPETIQALTKNNNYLVAIGTQSVEFFYDNANATGSPLQRNAPAVAQFGTPAPFSVAQTEKEVTMIGQTGSGGRTVWVIEGFQPTEIANAPIREALDSEGTNIGVAVGLVIQCAGHKWYLMNLLGAGRTFVYDYEEKMWHEWSFTTNGQQVFNYMAVADSGDGKPVLLSYGNANTVALDPARYNDYDPNNPGVPLLINCQVTTVKLDFDTIKRKRMFRLSLEADAPAPDGGAVAMYVQWSDDDYQNWTPQRLLAIGNEYPTITQLGYFRRRAFRFIFQQNWPLRMESFECDIIQEVRR